MSVTDPDAIACRRLWVEVVISVMMEYWQARRAAARSGRGDPARAVDDARRYFRSGDGRLVLSMAGIEPTEAAIDRILAIVAGEISPVELTAKTSLERAAA